MMRALTYALPALLVGVLAWGVEHLRLSAELADTHLTHTEQLRAITKANTQELERATRQAESLQQQVAALDTRYTQELTNAKANADRLRDAVDSGAKRLRILAKRPAHCPAVPGAPGDTSLGDGAGLELDPVARRAYFSLRAGIDRDTAKLNACQGILRQLTARNDHGATGGPWPAD